MSIDYRETKEFTPADLESLFLSVEWSSGHFPERLARAMTGFGTVVSAWDGETLVGLASAMDDGEMTAYVHYLLVRPGYQDRGIGRELMRRVNEHYNNYLRIVVIAVNEEVEFYKNCGYSVGKGKTPLFVTSLWT
jgi:ribosomal protein S18 acetylase RimI-like enzyme